MMEQDFIKDLTERDNNPLTQEHIDASMSILKRNGWKQENAIHSDYFSHKSIEKGFPIFHWTEALIRNSLMV